jgi:hypothetical protein
MCFKKPQRLIEHSRIGSQEVGGIGVPGIVGFVGRRTHPLGNRGVAVDQRSEMVARSVDVGRVGR